MLAKTNQLFQKHSEFVYFLPQGKEVVETKSYVKLNTPQDHINLHLRGGHVIPVQDPAKNTQRR